jgi:hypothetical protein
MRRTLYMLVASMAILLSPSLIANPDHPIDAYPTTFANPRVDRLATGTIVINLELAGEHRGLLTLNLEPDASGVLGGNWVLAERYTDNTDPATGVEPPSHDDHESAVQHESASAAGADAEHLHRDYVRYLDNGTISGTISAAALDIDADGRLVDFRAQLSIVSGSLTFEGITGSGIAELTRGLLLTTGGVR